MSRLPTTAGKSPIKPPGQTSSTIDRLQNVLLRARARHGTAVPLLDHLAACGLGPAARRTVADLVVALGGTVDVPIDVPVGQGTGQPDGLP